MLELLFAFVIFGLTIWGVAIVCGDPPKRPLEQRDIIRVGEKEDA
jgi:hypothetical protein